jgi:hypothetical protein
MAKASKILKSPAIKQFTINCDFSNGNRIPVKLYIGNPAAGSHPLLFQSKWLADNKGGNIPTDIMNSFEKLSEISERNRVSFEELCAYVIEELQSDNSIVNDAESATELSKNNDKHE